MCGIFSGQTSHFNYHDFYLDRWVYNVYLCLPKSKRNDYKRKYEEMVMEWIKKYNGK